MTSDKTPIDRDAARVVLLDRDQRILLFRCHEPGAQRSFWITPGGGLEPGETHEQAALRELDEETGLTGVDLGPCVWTRTHTLAWQKKTYCQKERFFVLRVDGHEVDPVGHTEEELMVLTEHRWWSADEILEASDVSFAPRKLGAYLAQLIAHPLPAKPIDVGT